LDILSRANGLYDEFDDKYGDPIKQMNRREESRLNKAIRHLNDEEIIEYELSSEVLSILKERKMNMKDHVNGVRSNKRENIKEKMRDMKEILSKIEEEFGE